jgi:TIR domain
MAKIEVLLCYAQKDKDEAGRLAVHLGVLRRQGFFDEWHDSEISTDAEAIQETDVHLDTAHIIILVISQYFINSHYCYCIEMMRAMERHEQGEARVIPVILRPVFFQRTPFAKLQPLPTNCKPLISWSNRDNAFFTVAEGIRKVAEELSENSQ